MLVGDGEAVGDGLGDGVIEGVAAGVLAVGDCVSAGSGVQAPGRNSAARAAGASRVIIISSSPSGWGESLGG